MARAQERPQLTIDAPVKIPIVLTVNGADHWYSIPNHLARTYLNEMAQAAGYESWTKYETEVVNERAQIPACTPS